MKSFWLLLCLSLVALNAYLSTPTPKKLIKSSVAILALNEKSGGSGVIFQSHKSHTTILTNYHVCKVVSEGGWVVDSDEHRYHILALKEDNIHDLCLVKI